MSKLSSHMKWKRPSWIAAVDTGPPTLYGTGTGHIDSMSDTTDLTAGAADLADLGLA